MPLSSADEMPLADQDPPLESDSERPQARRIRKLRSNVQSIFVGGGRGDTMPSEERSNGEGSNDGGRDGPKTPRFTITMPNLPSTRLIIPYLRRSNSNANGGTHSNNSSEPSSNVSSALPSPSFPPSRPLSIQSLVGRIQRTPTPEPVVIRDDRRDRAGRRTRRVRDYDLERQEIGVGPEEQELADMAARGRRRGDRRKRRPTQVQVSTRQVVRSRSRNVSASEHRTRLKRQAVKTKIVSCTASGLFLTMLLSIYLALALSNKIASQEFHVIIILIILVTTIFFCHSLIRLCILLVRPASQFDDETSSRHAQPLYARGGYAQPEQPIRVQLLRDEEAAGIESEVTKFPPPAYGLWRESVRVDPNGIYWARNTEAVPDVPSIPSQHRRNPTPESGEEESGNSLERTATNATRPPSYVSEDGVGYVIEAQGRSITPPEPESGISEMSREHANMAYRDSRDYERRTREALIDQAREALRDERRDERRARGISLSNAREVIRRERTSTG